MRGLLLACLLAACPASAQTVVVTVGLGVAEPVTAVLRYGETPAYELGVLPSVLVATEHTWVVLDLRPDTLHYFQYITSDATSGAPHPPVAWTHRTDPLVP